MSQPNVHDTAAGVAPAGFPRAGANHRWVILGVGAAAQASFAATFAGLPVTGVLMRSAYKMSTEQLGLVLGSIALGVTVSEIVWGLLTDRYGDRRVLLSGLLSTALALLVLGLYVVPAGDSIPSHWVLGAGLCLVGVLGGSVNASSGRAIMGWFTDGRRGLAMSIRQTAVPVGGAIGAAVLPWLAQTHGFAAVYGTLCAFCALSALATWRWVHEPAPSPVGAGASQAPASRSPLRRADVWRLAIAAGLLTVPQLAVLTFGGIFLHDHLGASVATIAAVLFVVQIGGSIARIVVGRESDKGRNRRTLMRAIGLGAAVLTGLLAVMGGQGLVWAIPLVCLTGLMASAWHGVAYTEIAVMAGPAHAGTALGIAGMTIFSSAFLTPTLIPHGLAASSWELVWGAIALAALLAVPLSPGAQAATRPSPRP